MKKRVLSILTAITLVCSASAFAKRRADEAEINRVNLTPYGHFDGEYTLRHIHTMSDPEIVISWVNGGANGSKGAMKIETEPWYSASFHIPNIIGETYEVSFFARVDGAPKQLAVQPTFADGNYMGIIYYSNFTPEWKKYSFTYYCDGQTSLSDLKFSIQCGDMTAREAFYIDEFSVVTSGKVSGASLDLPTKAQMNTEDAPTPQNEIYDNKFNDIADSWAKSIITVLAANDMVQGKGNGIFCPDESVTRGEFVTMIANLLSLKGRTYENLYTDVITDDWFSQNVQALGASGIIDPAMTADGLFRPYASVTREEAASMLYNSVKLSERLQTADSSTTFSDADEISPWAIKGVSNAAAMGIISGYSDNTFKPQKVLTRAEAAMLVMRAYERRERLAVFVDGENGNDQNDGTYTSPLATVEAARLKVMPWIKNMKRDIYVFIKEGTYSLSAPVKWSASDSGRNGFSVIYTSWGKEKPNFTMGKEYGGFQLHDKEKNIFKTYVGTDAAVTQVFFDGKSGKRASGELSLVNAEKNDAGFYLCDNTELLELSHFEDVTLICTEGNRRCRVIAQSCEKTPEGRVKITVKPESWSYHNAVHALAIPTEVENSYELLDCSGEWFFSKIDGNLYYIPFEDENPDEITAYVPGGETAFIISENNSFKKAANLKFDNLHFSGTAFLYPYTNGNGWCDEGMNYERYAGDGGKLTGGKEDAAFNITNAENIHITNCRFSELGGAGVNLRKTFSGCNISGNEFYNIAASAINLGNSRTDDEKYRNPTEKLRMRSNNLIKNNVIQNTGFEFKSSAAITVASICDSEISGNVIYDVPSLGIYTEIAESEMQNVKITVNDIEDALTVTAKQ